MGPGASAIIESSSCSVQSLPSESKVCLMSFLLMNPSLSWSIIWKASLKTCTCCCENIAKTFDPDRWTFLGASPFFFLSAMVGVCGVTVQVEIQQGTRTGRARRNTHEELLKEHWGCGCKSVLFLKRIRPSKFWLGLEEWMPPRNLLLPPYWIMLKMRKRNSWSIKDAFKMATNWVAESSGEKGRD